MSIELLQKQLNTKLDIKIIEQSLIHISYINSNNDTNKNSDFLYKTKCSIGRNIIGLIARIYYVFETNKVCSDITSSINVESIASHFYDKYDLQKYIILSDGERSSGTIKYIDQVFILAYELYSEEGYKFVYNLFKDSIRLTETKDYKTILQEYVQQFKQVVKYETVNSITNPTPSFTVKLTALNSTSTGTATSKKAAEKIAAELYIKKNNIPIKEKKRNSISNYLKSSTLTARRYNQLKELVTRLNIPEIYVDYKIFDLALTHSSWFGKNKVIDYSKELSILGSQLFVIEYHRANLLYHLDLNNTKFTQYSRECSKIINEENCFNKISQKYKSSIPANYKLGNNNISISSYLTDAYKNILGALLYTNFISNLDEINFQNFCLQFIDKLDLNNCDTNDYCNWILDLLQIMNIDVLYDNISETGYSHNKIFSSAATLILDKYGINNITVQASESSKVKLKETLAKKIFFVLKDNMNITNNLHKLNNIPNNFLDDLISYSLKPTSFSNMKLNMIGGLLLTNWNKNSASLLINELKKRELNNQVEVLQNIWSKVYSGKYDTFDLLDANDIIYDENKNSSNNYSNNKSVSQSLLDILNSIEF